MQTFKLDMHVHTKDTSPCGKISGTELVHLYKEAGYQGVVITDHYFDGYFEALSCTNWEEKIEKYLEGYRNAVNEGLKIGFDVILGIELRFQGSANDHLVYGIDEDFLMENRELYKLDLSRFVKLIRGRDILVFQAHPYRSGCTPADPALLDGVEIYNGNPRYESYNDKAYDFAARNNLRMISGSDFHRQEDLARGGIVTSEAIKDAKQLVSVLIQNKAASLIGFENLHR